MTAHHNGAANKAPANAQPGRKARFRIKRCAGPTTPSQSNPYGGSSSRRVPIPFGHSFRT